MRLAIIGSGSLGSLFAAFLSSQVDLVLLGHWPAQMARLRESGLTLIHIDGHHSHHAFSVSRDPSAIPPVEIVLVLVKSYQTLGAAREAESLLTPDGLAITLQNGLGNLEMLARILGSNRVAQGVTSLGANMVEPGIVRHAGNGQVYLAVSGNNRAILEQLAGWMNASGLEAELAADVDSLVWGKLAVNTGINPLTALLHVPNGFLASNETARSLAYDAAEETAAVADSLGINLPFPSAGLRTIEVAQHTAQNYSSMLQDVLRNAPTEIDAICGEVIRYGRQSGVPTPINEEFFRLLTQSSNTTAAKHQTSEIKPLQVLLSERKSLAINSIKK